MVVGTGKICINSVEQPCSLLLTCLFQLVKVPMKRKLSFSYLNEVLKLLRMLIWSSFIFHLVLDVSQELREI